MDNSARVILTKVWCFSVAAIVIRKKNIGRISNEIKRLSTRDIRRFERNRDITASLGRAQNRSTANSRAGTKLRFPDKQKRSQREALLLRKRIVAAGSRGIGRKTRGIRYQVAKGGRSKRKREETELSVEREIPRFNISRAFRRASSYKEPRISAFAMSHLGAAIARGREGTRELTSASFPVLIPTNRAGRTGTKGRRRGIVSIVSVRPLAPIPESSL